MSLFLIDPAAVLADAAVASMRLGPPLLAATAVLLLPGVLTAFLLRRHGALTCGGEGLAAAPGLGVLGVALAWWVADLAGVPFDAPLLVALTGLAGSAAVVVLLRARPRLSFGVVWLLVLWVLAGVTRLVVVRDLALPAWVDAPHHTYIAQLMLERRGIPVDYRPLIDAGPFAYHFGFHALAASASALSGAPVSDSVLAVGQLMSAAAVPSAFLLARLYGASTFGALGAAAAAGLVSMMPAYYVSWSRFTQLAGLVAAPGWLLLARRAGRGPLDAAVAGLASAAMLFVHPRVAAMLALLVVADRLIQPDRWLGGWRWQPVAPLVAALAAAPWLGRLFDGLIPRLAAPTEGIELANALDVSALSTYYDPWLYGLAVAAAIAGLTAGSLAAWVLVAWAALVFVASNPGLLGLPGTYMLSNGSVVISLWLPAAAVVGCGLGAVASGLGRRLGEGGIRRLAPLAPAVLVMAGVALSDGPLAALNPGTVLATPRDRRVLAELGGWVPAGAPVAVNVREWQLGIYMGSDAGYWIGVITPGRATVPPLIYPLEPLDRVRARGERLARWQAAGGDPAALAAQMRAQQIEWLFVGERGGSIDASRLTSEAGFDLVLADGPVRLYRLKATTSP